MRVGVIGCGYLGATHAAAMADLGFDVIGVDVDPAKVAQLNEGRVPFYEPGLPELLAKGVDTGRLRFTTALTEVADWADVHFVCVATPQRVGELSADISQVHEVLDALAPLLTRPTVVAGKSTVPVGTARELRARLQELSPAGAGVELAWNPEFLREAHGVEDTLHPDRIILGLHEDDTVSEGVLREVYARTIAEDGTPALRTNLETAEMVKVSANSFLATKISFINAMSEICEVSGADVTVLADAIGLDRRIGRQFLNAGLGFGGGCLPKDIRAFMARAGELGVPEALSFLREVDAVNERRRQRVVDLTTDLIGRPVLGSRIAVLGASFKPDTDDIRDSPALNVAGRLHLLGAHVTVYDPQAMENARRSWPTLRYAETALEAAAGAHAVLLLTEWSEFLALDPAVLAQRVDQPLLVDTRNVIDRDVWGAAGWTVRYLGRA